MIGRTKEAQRKKSEKKLKKTVIMRLPSRPPQEVWQRKYKLSDETLEGATEDELVVAGNREEEALSCTSRQNQVNEKGKAVEIRARKTRETEEIKGLQICGNQIRIRPVIENEPDKEETFRIGRAKTAAAQD